jgi:hypothetical protein
MKSKFVSLCLLAGLLNLVTAPAFAEDFRGPAISSCTESQKGKQWCIEAQKVKDRDERKSRDDSEHVFIPITQEQQLQLNKHLYEAGDCKNSEPLPAHFEITNNTSKELYFENTNSFLRTKNGVIPAKSKVVIVGIKRYYCRNPIHDMYTIYHNKKSIWAYLVKYAADKIRNEKDFVFQIQINEKLKDTILILTKDPTYFEVKQLNF